VKNALQSVGLQSVESGKEKVERHSLFLYQTPLVACHAPTFSILLIDRTPGTAKAIVLDAQGLHTRQIYQL